jgi:hypothetical protein
MIHIKVFYEGKGNTIPYLTLTDKNEKKIKEQLSKYPLDTIIQIEETGEKMKIEDIFSYDINNPKV